MNLTLSGTTQRQSVIEIFNRFQSRAMRDWLIAALFSRKPNRLKDFAEILPQLNPNRVFSAQQDIPVEQITGSVGRATDYDAASRPLKKNLRDRWVAMYLSLQNDSWPPILVYKVCDEYYVEDGHHRVSVARHTGMSFVQAEVWEYTLKTTPVVPAATQPLKSRAVVPVPQPCGCEPSPSGQML